MTATKILAVVLIFGSAVFLSLILVDTQGKLVGQTPFSQSKSENPLTLSTLLTQTEPTAEEISRKIALELSKLNPQGPSKISGVTGVNAIEPEEMLDRILANELTSIDFKDFEPRVDLDDLKIISDSNPKLAESYLKNFRTILENNFAGAKFDSETASVKDFQFLVSIYNKTISQFYSLNVPESLASIHLQEIKLLGIQRSVFEALANYEKDPVKAMVASQLLVELDEKFEVLKNEIVGFVNKNQLEI